MIDRDRLTRVDRFDPDRGCFACGPDNPHGLGMTFYTDGRAYYSWPTIPGHMIGWDRIAHGGVVTAILDEMMSWTAIQQFRRIILTRSMTVSFKRPVFVDQPLEAIGRVVRRDSERSATLSAELRNADGQLCTRAQGEFALFTPTAARRLPFISPRLIAQFEACLSDPIDPTRA